MPVLPPHAMQKAQSRAKRLGVEVKRRRAVSGAGGAPGGRRSAKGSSMAAIDRRGTGEGSCTGWGLPRGEDVKRRSVSSAACGASGLATEKSSSSRALESVAMVGRLH
eukprot:7377549-Prymnesium_polylepis.3